MLDPVGLESLAVTCRCYSSELTDDNLASTVGPAYQETSRAVAIVHADLEVIRAMLGDRMVSTAVKLAASANTYSAQDANSAAKVSAAGAFLEA
jgi:hypothetical protein